MRTKTLLLAAALTAAGVATSMAQVYSVNAVGYVNTTIHPGFNLVSNPLTAADNTIATLFKTLPVNSVVYKFTGSGYIIATLDPDDGVYLPVDAANTTVVPGEGVFVKSAGSTDLTVTFVGEVSQGDLSNPLPAGLSIRSSQVPQAGTAAELGLVGEPNDIVYQYKAVGAGYDISTFDPDDLVWAPPLRTLKVGEAFFLKKAKAGVWTRHFSVNG